MNEHELEAVERWQRERFLELGFTVAAAERLVRAGADWHRVAAVKATGCPLRTLLRLYG